MPHFAQLFVDLLEHAFTQHVAHLDVHLRGVLHALRDRSDAARPITRTGEVFVALQPHAPTDVERKAPPGDFDIIRAALVDVAILIVFTQVFVHGLGELLLGKGVVLLRHADIPQDVFVADLRDQQPAR